MSEQRHDLVMPSVASELSGMPQTTLRRWALAGRVRSQVTPGGHHRYDRAEMVRIGEVIKGLRTTDVAAMFGVDQKTVTRWVEAGRIPASRTPGGKVIRFRREEIEALLNGGVRRVS